MMQHSFRRMHLYSCWFPSSESKIKNRKAVCKCLLWKPACGCIFASAKHKNYTSHWSLTSVEAECWRPDGERWKILGGSNFRGLPLVRVDHIMVLACNIPRVIISTLRHTKARLIHTVIICLLWNDKSVTLNCPRVVGTAVLEWQVWITGRCFLFVLGLTHKISIDRRSKPRCLWTVAKWIGFYVLGSKCVIFFMDG